MTRIEIISEHEQPRGWVFQARILRDDVTIRQLQLRLAWADYNHWSADGAVAPAKVAEAVVAFLNSHADVERVPQAVDAATIRRQFAGADDAIRDLLRR